MQYQSLLSLDASLRAALKGRVITAADPAYDEMRAVHHGGISRRPAIIARPLDAADVGHVIAHARGSGLPLAVRSGGHSGAGHGTTEGGIVLDMRDMGRLEVDAVRRTAWAGTGLTTGEYTTGVGALGLATGFGDTGSVGLGGITLGGGVGYLARQHGLTIDNVLAAEVVTANGECLHVDAVSHPDLFWAIRGGGGNFGVVTRFQYRLHPIDHVVGGMLLLPATPDVIAGMVEAADAAPDALSIIANVMPAPPMPFVPETQHGRLSVLLLMCHVGGVEAGTAAIAPFRSLAPAIADMVRPVRYPELFPPEDSRFQPKAVGRTMFVDTVDRRAAGTILDHLQQCNAPLRVVQLRVLGGALARVPAADTAYAHRQRRIMVVAAASYDNAAERREREAWLSTVTMALDQGDCAAYVNFLGDEGAARVRAAYPGATWDRLASIKARYDPENLFRNNQNIAPAGTLSTP